MKDKEKTLTNFIIFKTLLFIFNIFFDNLLLFKIFNGGTNMANKKNLLLLCFSIIGSVSFAGETNISVSDTTYQKALEKLTNFMENSKRWKNREQSKRQQSFYQEDVSLFLKDERSLSDQLGAKNLNFLAPLIEELITELEDQYPNYQFHYLTIRLDSDTSKFRSKFGPSTRRLTSSWHKHDDARFIFTIAADLTLSTLVREKEEEHFTGLNLAYLLEAFEDHRTPDGLKGFPRAQLSINFLDIEEREPQKKGTKRVLMNFLEPASKLAKIDRQHEST